MRRRKPEARQLRGNHRKRPGPYINRIRKSLRFSFYDGVFASVMVGFTQDYFVPFLLLIRGTAKHVALLSALPNLFAALVQIKSANFSEIVKSRKLIVSFFVLCQAVFLLSVVVLACYAAISPAIFITLIVLFTCSGSISGPAWGSIMADIVPAKKRGTYFGWRFRTLGFITVITALCAGFYLNNYAPEIGIARGFALIFFLAFLARFISFYFLTRMHEPHLEYKKEHYFSIIDFIRGMKKSNFARFVMFVAMMNFAVNIASPFFAVLMLRDLHFNYLLYITITVTATLTIYLTIQRWGTHADRVGNMRIITFVSPLIGVIPLLWVINRNPGFLICAQVFSGFLWAGFNLATTNFIYDAVTPEKRVRCISYFNALNGVALCCGALAGGFLLKHLPFIFGSKILPLFLISSFLRLIIGFFMPRMLKEVRAVEHMKNYDLFFSMVKIKPFIGIERRTLRY